MVIAPKTIVMYKLHSLFNKVRTKRRRQLTDKPIY